MHNYLKHLPKQWPVIEAMAKAVFKPADASGGKTIHETTLPAVDAELVSDFIDWAGAAQAQYPQTIPAHLFPQWGFPFLAANIETLPYPMQKVLNQGCEISQKGPLPLGEDLRVACHLVEVREEEARVRIHQRLTTGTAAQPDLISCDLFGVVVTGKSAKKSSRVQEEENPWLPVGGWTASPNEGLSFAMLTGDFNPIHWVGPYAKHAGFNNAILHGFASLSRTYETLLQNAPASIPYLPRINVRFTRPLVLPNRMEVHIQEGNPTKVRLVDENGVVCMAGDYSLESSESSSAADS